MKNGTMVLLCMLGLWGSTSLIPVSTVSSVTDLMVCFIDKSEDPNAVSEKSYGPIVMRAYAALFSSATALLMTSYVLALIKKFYQKAPLEKWQVFELSPEFFLLVNEAVKIEEADSELIYGLKLKGLKKLSVKLLKNRIDELDPLRIFGEEPSYEAEEAFSRAFRDIFFTQKKLDDQMITMSHLFVTHQERARYGARAGKIPEPRYALIFEGHGMPPLSIEGGIASVKQEVESHKNEDDYDDFVAWGKREIKVLEKKRLQGQTVQPGEFSGVLVPYFTLFLYDFLDGHAPVVLAVVNSCYAGGTNLKEMTSFGAEIFSRATSAITLVVTAAVGGSVASFSGKKNFSYDEFKKHLMPRGQDKADIVAAVNAIMPFYYDERFGKVTSYANIPLVRYPGQEWSQTLVKLPSIGRVLAFSRNPSDPLNVRTFFQMKAVSAGTGVEPLLLYATKILFPLVFDAQLPAFPAIISMVQGDAIISIEEINAPTFPLSHVVEAFFSVKDLAEDKAFIIKTIKARDDVTGGASGPDTSFEAFLLNRDKGDEQIEHFYLLIKKERGVTVGAYRASCVYCEPALDKPCPRCEPLKRSSWTYIGPAFIAAAMKPVDEFLDRLKKAPQHKGPLKQIDLSPRERQTLESMFPQERMKSSLERLAGTLHQLSIR